jgi:opacity protein-like surface antigen
MKKILTSLIALSITFPVIADTGFYGGLSIGTTDNQSKSSASGVSLGEDFNDTAQFSGDSTSYSIRGGYQLHENLVVEFGHYEYGKVTYTYIDDFDDSIKDKIETNSNNLGVKAIWPITELISLNVSVGIAKWNFDADSTDSSLPDEIDFSEDGTNMYYGVGFEYHINNSLSIGVEYSSLSMEWGTSGSEENFSYKSDIEHKVNNLSLVLQMKF